MIIRLTLAVLLAASPLCAEANLDPTAPARPGAVALYVQARSLHDLGQTAKDPLMVLSAARLMRGLTLTDTPRIPDPAPSEATPLTALDAKTMLDTARSLDAGQTFTDLIEYVAREVVPQPKALRATAATLAPGDMAIWTLAFFGGSYAELAIVGHADGNLDLLVSDDKGIHICLDNGSGDTALCGFTPAENGRFIVTVTNPGKTPDTYLLLTN